MITTVAEPPRTVTPGRRAVLAKSFDDLAEALEHAVALAGRGQGYRVTLRGDGTEPTGPAIQIVDQGSVFGDGESGLTVVISRQAIDPADFLNGRRFGRENHFEPVPSGQGYQSAARFGADVAVARAVVERLLPEADDKAGGRYWTVISRVCSTARPCR